MCKGNSNHPKKGSSIKVDPIRNFEDLKHIKKLLYNNKRNLCLFVLGINTNLRGGDILNLKVGIVKYLTDDNDEIEIKEGKTKKNRRITINKCVRKCIKDYLAERMRKEKLDDSDYLFVGKRGNMTIQYLNKLVKNWSNNINLKGNYGSHSLRKTWGYHQRVTFKVDIPSLMYCFNHTSQRMTLDYLCIQAEEIKNIYYNEL